MSGAARGRSMAAIAAGAVAGAVGAALLALAVPIVGAGLAQVPGNAIAKRLSDETPGVESLRILARSREAGLRWRETGRAATELGLAHMLLAETDGAGTVDRAGAIVRAETALVGGLGLAPMDPYGWMRLVRVRMARGHPADAVAPALGLAIHTGPREARLRWLTVEAGLYAWSALDPDDRNAIAGRVRDAWASDPVRIAALAAGVGRTALLSRLVLYLGNG